MHTLKLSLGVSPRAKTDPLYIPESRRQMVNRVRVGRLPEELAREFEPTGESICAWVAKAEGRKAAARRHPLALLQPSATLRAYAHERLSGAVAVPGERKAAGPMVAWKGRRHGPRQARRWAKAWSPEQIARRLPLDFADDETMRISHEAIYQALYVQSRGALRRELTACLRTGRALRVPRARSQREGKSFVGRRS